MGRSALVAMATPKQKMFELEPERDWLERHGTDPLKLTVNVGSFESEVGTKTLTVEIALTDTVSDLKSKLVSMGIKSVPTNKMKLHTEPVGYLKDRLPLAYYNLLEGCEIELSKGSRGGVRYRKDHAVPQKRPKTQDKTNQPSNPEDYLKQQREKLNPTPAVDIAKAPAGLTDLAATLAAAKAPGGVPGLPGLSGLPSLPSLPGLTGLPGLGAGASAPKLPGLAGLAGLGLPGASGPAGGLSLLGGTSPALGLGGTMPGLGGLGNLPAALGGKAGGLPGLPQLGGLSKATGTSPALGLELPGLPKLGGLPPGLSLGGAPMSKGGGAPKAPGLLLPA